MALENLRDQIDQVDKDLIQAFIDRMDLVQKISQVKKDQGLALEDRSREDNILKNLENKAYSKDLIKLYKLIFQISKDLQGRALK